MYRSRASGVGATLQPGISEDVAANHGLAPLHSGIAGHKIRPMSQTVGDFDGVPRLSSAVGEIHVARAAEVMASTLRSEIFQGRIKPGTLLPTERELAAESGLSRASVREALKSLAHDGLLLAKVGRGGGYLVQEPPRDAVIRSLDVFIRGRAINGGALVEVRKVIEPACAAFAAERRSEHHLHRLRALTEEMSTMTDDITSFLDLNIDWHILIAEASGNEVLASVMVAISTNIRSAIGADEYGSPEMMQAAQRLHESVVKAIADGDAAAAHRRMHRHLHAAGEVIIRPQTAPTPSGSRARRA